jgi:hypothetical protein
MLNMTTPHLEWEVVCQKYVSRSYQRTGRVIPKQVAYNTNICDTFRLLCVVAHKHCQVVAHKYFQVLGRIANCRGAPS